MNVGELAEVPLIVSLEGTVGKFRVTDRPVLAEDSGDVYVIDRALASRAVPRGRFRDFAVKVDPVPPETDVPEVARLMVEHGVDAYPVKGRKLLAVTEEAILRNLRDTPLARREARAVMCPVKAVSERAKKVQGVVPVVNDSGKLVAAWVNGKLSRRPLIARAGTHVKLVIDKLMKGPVIVVDKRRTPIGVVTRKDVLALAASFREQEAPVFYSGLEFLPSEDGEALKLQVAEAMKKITRVTPVSHASFHLGKRGVWSVKFKLSTPFRTFLSGGEAEELGLAVAETLDRMVEEVLREKEKRVKLRKVY